MGTKTSQPAKFDPSLQGWEKVETIDNYSVWRNKDTADEIEEYRQVFNQEKQFNREREIFQFRYNSNNMVASRFYREDTQKDMCSTFFKGFLFIERIPLRLSQIKDIPYPDAIHMYQQTIRGFAELYDKFGYFHINQQNIGMNQQGKVKTWSHSNLSMSYAENKKDSNGLIGTEKDMLCRLLEIINVNVDHSTFPENITAMFKRSNPQTFRQAHTLLQNYCTRHKTPVPLQLDCVLDMRPQDVLGGKASVSKNLGTVSDKISDVPINPIMKSTADPVGGPQKTIGTSTTPVTFTISQPNQITRTLIPSRSVHPGVLPQPSPVTIAPRYSNFVPTNIAPHPVFGAGLQNAPGSQIHNKVASVAVNSALQPRSSIEPIPILRSVSPTRTDDRAVSAQVQLLMHKLKNMEFKGPETKSNVDSKPDQPPETASIKANLAGGKKISRKDIMKLTNSIEQRINKNKQKIINNPDKQMQSTAQPTAQAPKYSNTQGTQMNYQHRVQTNNTVWSSGSPFAISNKYEAGNSMFTHSNYSNRPSPNQAILNPPIYNSLGKTNYVPESITPAFSKIGTSLQSQPSKQGYSSPQIMSLLSSNKPNYVSTNGGLGSTVPNFGGKTNSNKYESPHFGSKETNNLSDSFAKERESNNNAFMNQPGKSKFAQNVLNNPSYESKRDYQPQSKYPLAMDTGLMRDLEKLRNGQSLNQYVSGAFVPTPSFGGGVL